MINGSCINELCALAKDRNGNNEMLFAKMTEIDSIRQSTCAGSSTQKARVGNVQSSSLQNNYRVMVSESITWHLERTCE